MSDSPRSLGWLADYAAMLKQDAEDLHGLRWRSTEVSSFVRRVIQAEIAPTGVPLQPARRASVQLCPPNPRWTVQLARDFLIGDPAVTAADAILGLVVRIELDADVGQTPSIWAWDDANTGIEPTVAHIGVTYEQMDER